MKSATFVYVDPGRHTDKELQRWATEHRPLWSRLRELGTAVHVAVITRTVAAQRELSRKVAAWLSGLAGRRAADSGGEGHADRRRRRARSRSRQWRPVAVCLLGRFQRLSSTRRLPPPAS